jgi:hypothetical protein
VMPSAAALSSSASMRSSGRRMLVVFLATARSVLRSYCVDDPGLRGRTGPERRARARGGRGG